ncbi:MBL fold metallo-hydrolase [Longispora albida]|uniref:MBL fold metallo-hydrolase n=1 Tax=Longispora albida TaxID=203523 RepID=UPI00037A0D9F|nr:MBL fold metallo-hydrolase [Longispora albida]
MWITFLGAAGTVTGSRHLVEAGDSRILVDCGMFQGDRELRRRNWQPLGYPPGQLDAVVLTHAHLDHCGWLPRLVAEGFTGQVLCSPSTAELAAIILRDAAHLQEEDAEYANRIGSSRHHPALPLFDTAAAERAIGLLSPVAFGETVTYGGADITLHRAGHILGSATVTISDGTRTVTFSGDLGRDTHPLLLPPDPLPDSDAVVIESTYGDRQHPPRSLDRFATEINASLRRGGVVLMPAFAVDRTAVLLMSLRELVASGRVPDVPVFADSPMALAALDVYRKAIAGQAPDIRPLEPGDPFDPGKLKLVPGKEGSVQLNHPGFPCVIISAAGMLTGGRVVHHFEALAPDPRNLILLAGFQVPGTRGRAIADGVREIKAFGRYTTVRARVVTLDEFSCHADADGLIRWLGSGGRPPATCFVVHGEHDPATALASRIRGELGRAAVIPRMGERVRL